jgi:tetratricopeptide (TPR) repeat protein
MGLAAIPSHLTPSYRIMKTPSSRLYDLVKSLTSAERRYFKLYINSKDATSSKYERLFDAIAASDGFDEEKLVQAVYGKEPSETRKYSELKSYLYDLVIRSLQSFDEKTSVDYRLKNQLLGVRALFKRSHFEDCKTILAKVKKTATEYEDFKTLVEVLDWEKKIAYTQNDFTFLGQEMQRIMSEEQRCLDKLSNISAYRSIFFEILVKIRKDVSRSQAQRENFAALMDNPLMQDESMASSFIAKVLFYRIQTIYNFSASNFEAFYESSTNLIHLLEHNKLMQEEDVSEYIAALSNHIVSCGRLGKIEEVRQTLDKLINVKPISEDDEAKINRQYYMNKFRLCISIGEFEEGAMELKRHLKIAGKYDKEQFVKSTFYLQYFCIYFGNCNFDDALNSLNNWLKLSENEERKDLQSLARILNLIIHYELGNTMLLDSLLRSTYRYLNKSNRLSEFERKMMNFIREVGKPHSKRETQQILETLKQDFEELSKQPSYGVFELFDIISWLESKINNKPYAEVVKERFLRQSLPLANKT